MQCFRRKSVYLGEGENRQSSVLSNQQKGCMKMKAKSVALSLYFGIPGAGKSTFAAYLAKKDMKK